MSRLNVPCLIIIIFQITSCKPQPTAEDEAFVANDITTENNEVSEIIYSLYLPTDMSFIFEKTGSNFNPEIPASTDDFSMYSEDEQIAVMLGVYGADMMYMKLLGQLPLAASYFQVINNMAAKISDTRPVFGDAVKNIEKYLSDEDSVSHIIEEAYSELNNLFTISGKENLTSLALMGGWIETMYIGIEIMQNNELTNVMANRILQQKYSLNSIYTLLQNNQESLSARGYLLLLKKLKLAFEDVEIKFNKEGFTLDTAQKKIQATNSKITYSEETLYNISNMILDVRDEIIMVK